MKDLLTAAESGDLEQVKKALAAGANSSAKDKDGLTPLMKAVIKSHSEIVKLLLEEGSNVDDVDAYGWSAMLWAASL
jgi:ankyrin repeat protein